MARIASLQVYALRGPKIARPHWTAFFPVPPGNATRWVLMWSMHPMNQPIVVRFTSHIELGMVHYWVYRISFVCFHIIPV